MSPFKTPHLLLKSQCPHYHGYVFKGIQCLSSGSFVVLFQKFELWQEGILKRSQKLKTLSSYACMHKSSK